MNATLKYLTISGVVAALVLAAGVTAGICVNRHSPGAASVDMAAGVRGAGDTHPQAATVPPVAANEQPACGEAAKVCGIPSVLEDAISLSDGVETHKLERELAAK